MRAGKLVPAQRDVRTRVATDRQDASPREAHDPLLSLAVAVKQERRLATRSDELLLQLAGEAAWRPNSFMAAILTYQSNANASGTGDRPAPLRGMRLRDSSVGDDLVAPGPASPGLLRTSIANGPIVTTSPC